MQHANRSWTRTSGCLCFFENLFKGRVDPLPAVHRLIKLRLAFFVRVHHAPEPSPGGFDFAGPLSMTVDRG